MSMRISVRLERYLVNALSHSMDVQVMEKLVARIIPGYEIHKRIGFPESISVPKRDAAQQIIQDLKVNGLVCQFAEMLIDVDEHGIMGRRVAVHSLQQIISEIEEMGLRYDEEYGVFIEGNQKAKTRGWGVLRPGVSYDLAFLKLDIVGNSRLVRRYSESTITKTYTWLKKTFQRCVEKRNGRIWSWEGDGGLAAFYLNDKNVNAALAGVEILHELEVYNLFERVLKDPLEIRIAVNTGRLQYSESVDLKNSPPLRHVERMESHYTEPNGLTLSPVVYFDLGTKLEKFFEAYRISNEQFVYRYKLAWE
jgi:hypothetical protein